MARVSVVFALFALLAATLVTAFNQTLELENGDCDNNCYFSSFPGGSCTDDVACMCNKHKYREAYFCCMKDCNPNVMPESITRQHRECIARNLDFTFDAEARCGVKLTTSAGIWIPATATTSTSSTAAVSPTGDSKSSTTSVSTTSAVSSTVSQGVSSAGNQTSSGSSTPTPTNGAPGKAAILNAVMALVAVSAIVLC